MIEKKISKGEIEKWHKGDLIGVGIDIDNDVIYYSYNGGHWRIIFEDCKIERRNIYGLIGYSTGQFKLVEKNIGPSIEFRRLRSNFSCNVATLPGHAFYTFTPDESLEDLSRYDMLINYDATEAFLMT
eukprot:UN25072